MSNSTHRGVPDSTSAHKADGHVQSARLATVSVDPRRPTAIQQEFGMLWSMWRRDLLRLRAEKSRWLGVVLQPLLFWGVIGSGMGNTFSTGGASAVNYLQYFFPGIVVMTVLFTAIFSTIAVIEDRQTGFLQSVVVAPASRFSLICGKILGVCSTVALQCALLLLVAPLAGISFVEINWIALFSAIFLTTVGLTGVTLTMAWVFSSAQSYHAVMSVVLLPLWVVSGAMFPRPESWVAYVMVLNPMTYAVDAMRFALAPTLAHALNVDGWTANIVLAVFALVTVGAAVWTASRVGGAYER